MLHLVMKLSLPLCLELSGLSVLGLKMALSLYLALLHLVLELSLSLALSLLSILGLKLALSLYLSTPARRKPRMGFMYSLLLLRRLMQLLLGEASSVTSRHTSPTSSAVASGTQGVAFRLGLNMLKLVW